MRKTPLIIAGLLAGFLINPAHAEDGKRSVYGQVEDAAPNKKVIIVIQGKEFKAETDANGTASAGPEEFTPGDPAFVYVEIYEANADGSRGKELGRTIVNNDPLKPRERLPLPKIGVIKVPMSKGPIGIVTEEAAPLLTP